MADVNTASFFTYIRMIEALLKVALGWTFGVAVREVQLKVNNALINLSRAVFVHRQRDLTLPFY